MRASLDGGVLPQVADESRSGRRRATMVYTRVHSEGAAGGEGDEDAEEEEEVDMPLNRHLTTKVLRMMRELRSQECAWPFLEPVALDDTPGYAEVVTQPMDLGTVQGMLEAGGEYWTLNQLARDLRLISANCLLFNAGAGELDAAQE
jgi:hypothetical protein